MPADTGVRLVFEIILTLVDGDEIERDKFWDTGPNGHMPLWQKKTAMNWKGSG